MNSADFSVLSETAFFQWVVFPVLIFAARIADVSLGTLRTVSVAQGVRKWAAALGVVEVLIWLTAISYILQNLTNPLNYLAYAAGFGTGNYVGLWLEEKMARGLVAVTTITHQDAQGLIEHLKEKGFGLTSVSARGVAGRVRLILSIVRRRQLEELRSIIEQFHPNAFIAIQPVKSVSKEICPPLNAGRKTFELRKEK